MAGVHQKKNTMKLAVLCGIIIGINSNQGCTLRQILSRAFWIKKKTLIALLNTAIEQGKVEETAGGLFKVSIIF